MGLHNEPTVRSYIVFISLYDKLLSSTWEELIQYLFSISTISNTLPVHFIQVHFQYNNNETKICDGTKMWCDIYDHENVEFPSQVGDGFPSVLRKITDTEL